MTNENFIQEVVELTNQFRVENGLAPLTIDSDLAEAAQSYTQAMAVGDFFSHVAPDGSRPWDRAQAAGYETGIIGENIGAGYRSPKAIVDGWIASDGHRAAMLNPRYNEIGVGYYFLENDPGRLTYEAYWTQLFGQGEIESPSNNPLPPSFDPLQYGASHSDLIEAYGNNPAALIEHYATFGATEGRALDSFNEVSYLASYDDLLNAFGESADAATQHYIQSGYFEGRSQTLFQSLQYLASYDDLIVAFGLNLDAAAQHFVQSGYDEGRSRDQFDEAVYLASNPDLVQSFGYALEAVTQHYIQYGMAEGRPTNSFDPATYLSNYTDLQAVFGSNLAAATRHFIEFGLQEGR